VTKTQCQVPSQINVTLTDEQRESLRASLSGGAGGPLVHPPQPALTADEWEAVWLAIGMFAEGPEHIKRHEEMADAMRGLLERLGGAR
jgi:hypothetical protein